MGAMKRIFHISNRVDIPEPGAATAGGLDETICKTPNGYKAVRFGWSGETVPDQDYDPDNAVHVTERDNITYVTVDLKQSDFDGFYNVISNGALWPLFHGLYDIAEMDFERKHVEAYNRVNEILARHAQRYIQNDDTVVVHDYHLIPLGKKMNQMGVENPVGFFLHTPVPTKSVVNWLETKHQNFVYGLLDHLYEYDFVGLQSPKDFKNLNDLIGRTDPNLMPDFFEKVHFESDPGKKQRYTAFGIFPVAGNTHDHAKTAATWRRRPEVQDFIDGLSRNYVDIVSWERLDYTKGIVAKAYGVGNWLYNYGQDHAHTHLLQICPIGSRFKIPAYRDEQQRIITSFRMLSQMTGDNSIEDLIVDTVPRATMLGVCAQSNIGLITPLNDGFNLTMTEYLAAQFEREDTPGVLIGSKFAGAAHLYSGAMITVDPYKTQDIAHAIQVARTLPASRKSEMIGLAKDLANKYTNDDWQQRVVRAIEDRSPKVA